VVENSGMQSGGDPIPDVPQRSSLLIRMHPVAFILFSLGLTFLLYQVVGGVAAWFLIQGRVTEENVQIARVTTLGGQLLLLLIPTVLLARARHRNEPGFFRFGVPDYRQILATVTGVFALQQVLQGYLVLQNALPLPDLLRDILDKLEQEIETAYRLLVASYSFPEFLFVIVVVALVPAITEELLFRGLVQGNLERAFGGMRAAVVTGIVFGAYHLSPFTLVPLIVLGVYFGFIVYKSQNLVVAISAHFFNNFLACTAAYMQLDEDFVAIAPSGGTSSGLIIANSLLFLLIFAASMVFFIRTAESRPDASP